MEFELTADALPAGWGAREPDERDLAALTVLRAGVARAATGMGAPDVETVTTEVTGIGSWTRRQLVVLDTDGGARAWAGVHDRTVGHTVLHVTVDPALAADVADPLAEALFAWCEQVAGWFSALRGESATQLDTGTFEGDARQQRWLAAAGYTRMRRWLQMSRPVTEEDTKTPVLRDGVRIRRVRRRPNGLPVAADVQAVHWMLESSFEDHFNAYRESFPEFVHRQQESPGHAWDHWWLATVVGDDGREWPGGAIVSTMSRPDASGAYGSYVDYIGVHRDARGKGIAKGLLRTVIADAAARGRGRVGLEVDASSPTGADGLYRSMGWETSYITESWHRDVRF